MSHSLPPAENTAHSEDGVFSISELGPPLLTPSYFSAREWVEQRERDKEVDGVDSDPEISEAIPQSASNTSALPSATFSSLQPPAGLGRNAVKNWKSQQKRNKSRSTLQEKNNTHLKQRSYRHIRQAANHILTASTSLQREYSPTKPAWIGPRDSSDWKVYSLEELVDSDKQWQMKVVDWDGRTCQPIVDADDRIIGVLGGMPKNTNWGEVQLEAARAIEAARSQLQFENKDMHHRRGKFAALGVGVSHGGGQKSPGVLSQGRNGPMLDQLMQIEPLKKISGFANCLFECYAPHLNKAYHTTLDALEQWSNDIVRNYPRTAWAASSINFGPCTESYPHVDFGNLSWGWCAITALGEFDPDKGGHLVLWDLKYIIRFPPGSTIIIPSAMIRHSNTSIGADEKRYSYAQYSAGGLFRWVNNGFKKDDEWLAMANGLEKAQREEGRKGRWKKGLDMLLSFDELRAI